jgi:hypothetical protein
VEQSAGESGLHYEFEISMTKKNKVPAAILKEVNKTLDALDAKYRSALRKALKKQAAIEKASGSDSKIKKD